MVKKATKNSRKKKEKVCEIFEIKKGGKTDVKQSCGTQEVERGDDKKQIEKENRLLRNFLIGIGVVLLIFILSYFIAGSLKTFNYNGVKVDIVKEVAPYRVSLPVMSNGEIVPYYFYLRKDPRVVGENVDFDGKMVFTDHVVFNGTDFECDGDGVIATANLVKLYDLIGSEVIKDANASCDDYGRYTLVNFEEGDKTNIEQFGTACYRITVANCEILDATERMMFEMFSEIEKKL